MTNKINRGVNQYLHDLKGRKQHQEIMVLSVEIGRNDQKISAQSSSWPWKLLRQFSDFSRGSGTGKGMGHGVFGRLSAQAYIQCWMFVSAPLSLLQDHFILRLNIE